MTVRIQWQLENETFWGQCTAVSFEVSQTWMLKMREKQRTFLQGKEWSEINRTVTLLRCRSIWMPWEIHKLLLKLCNIHASLWLVGFILAIETLSVKSSRMSYFTETFTIGFRNSLAGKPKESKTHGKSRRRWVGSTLMYLQQRWCKHVDWIYFPRIKD
jgi:hypothetical protein